MARTKIVSVGDQRAGLAVRRCLLRLLPEALMLQTATNLGIRDGDDALRFLTRARTLALGAIGQETASEADLLRALFAPRRAPGGAAARVNRMFLDLCAGALRWTIVPSLQIDLTLGDRPLLAGAMAMSATIPGAVAACMPGPQCQPQTIAAWLVGSAAPVAELMRLPIRESSELWTELALRFSA